MNILITGGSGFIGRHVARKALQNGHTIRVLTRQPTKSFLGSNEWGHQVELIQQDLQQASGLKNALQGIDAVIHCAAAMSGNNKTQYLTTVKGTRNLLCAMTDTKVKKIVGISTLALYDYQQIPSGDSLDENSPLIEKFDPAVPYIEMKRQQEDLIKEHCKLNGLHWTILRPGIVFGPTRTWSYHIGTQLGQRQWVGYAGDSLLPVTYVENCADAIVAAAELENAEDTTVNIVDDNLPQRRKYMEELAKRADPPPTITTISWKILEQASNIADWTNRKLIRESFQLPGLLQPAALHSRCKPLFYSNQSAKQILDWQPRWNFEEALERIYSDAAS